MRSPLTTTPPPPFSLSRQVGTFCGYSALCMAEGLAEGGDLLTLEIDPEAAAIAKDFFAQSPQGNRIELVTPPRGGACDRRPLAGLGEQPGCLLGTRPVFAPPPPLSRACALRRRWCTLNGSHLPHLRHRWWARPWTR